MALQQANRTVEVEKLSGTTFTDAERDKLAAIEAGAEVNVNADWDSVSGDSEILNKSTMENYSIVMAIALGMP
jgi:hypothetical protein